MTGSHASLVDHYAAVRQRMVDAARAHVRRPDTRPKRWSVAPAPYPLPQQRLRDVLVLTPTGGRIEVQPTPLLDEIEYVPPWKQILREVAEVRGVSVSAIIGPQRARNIVRARHEAMHRIYNDLCLSLPDIGRRVGGRDHSSVRHGICQHEKRLAEAQGGTS